MSSTYSNSQILELCDDDADTDSNRSKGTTSQYSVLKKKEPENVKLESNNANSFWSIDDDTFFYPLGLHSHGNSAGKCAFVTWGKYYILNFVFKISARTNRPKMTKVRLMLQVDDQIADMLITELNTFLLMCNGRVYYFSSVKSLHPINWISQVRCISATHAGFSLIRLRDDNKLHLEIYRDVLFPSSSTLLQSYDISFDTNLFNCQWQDERFTLYSQAILNEEHIHFMEQVISRACQLRVEQEVHFYTVCGHVFALIADITSIEEARKQTNFHIQLLCSYASDISFIQILIQESMFLVFLDCGSIDMWYISSQTRQLHRKTHHTGTEFTHYHYSTDTGCFYYTDEQQVAQLHFIYDAVNDSCYVREHIKSLPGILVITWAPSLQQLVCLSCNNIFYRLTFHECDEELSKYSVNNNKQHNVHSTELENLNLLYEMNRTRLSQLLQKAHVLNYLTQAPRQLHNAIERQYVKRQLISIAHKTRYYTHLYKAHLEYCMQLPTTHPPNTLLLYTEVNWLLQCNTIYALIRLGISNNSMLQAANWQLHVVQSDGITHLFQIPLDTIHAPLCVVVPIKLSEHKTLPEFHLKLLTLLNNANNKDHCAISLPIEVHTSAQTYAHLFSPTQRRLRISYAQHNALNLIMHFNLKNSKAIPKISSSVDKRAISCMVRTKDEFNFDRIATIFQVPKNLLSNDNNEFSLHFTTSALHLNVLRIEHQNYMQLQSKDPLALYYMKLHLSKCLNSANADDQRNINTSLLKKALHQYESFMQRSYSMVLQKVELTPQQLLQDLLRIHMKLRLETTPIYFSK